MVGESFRDILADVNIRKRYAAAINRDQEIQSHAGGTRVLGASPKRLILYRYRRNTQKELFPSLSPHGVRSMTPLILLACPLRGRSFRLS